MGIKLTNKQLKNFVSKKPIEKLQEIDVSSVTDLDGLFWNVDVPEEVDLRASCFENISTARGMFEDCMYMNSVAIYGKQSESIDMSYSFYGCNNLKYVKLFLNSKNYFLDKTFNGCNNIKAIFCNKTLADAICNYYKNPNNENDTEYFDMALKEVIKEGYKVNVNVNNEILMTDIKSKETEKMFYIIDFKKYDIFKNINKNSNINDSQIQDIIDTTDKFKIFCVYFNQELIEYNNILQEECFTSSTGEVIYIGKEINLAEIIKKCFIEKKKQYEEYQKEVLSELNCSYENASKYINIDELIKLKKACIEDEFDNVSESKYNEKINDFKEFYSEEHVKELIEAKTGKNFDYLKKEFSSWDWDNFIDEYKEGWNNDNDIERWANDINKFYWVKDYFENKCKVNLEEYVRFIDEYDLNLDIDVYASSDDYTTYFYDILENNTEKFQNEIEMINKYAYVNKLLEDIVDLEEMIEISNRMEDIKGAKIIYCDLVDGTMFCTNNISKNLLINLYINNQNFNNAYAVLEDNINEFKKKAISYANKYCLMPECKIFSSEFKADESTIEDLSEVFDFSYKLYYQLKRQELNNINAIMDKIWKCKRYNEQFISNDLLTELEEKLNKYGIKGVDEDDEDIKRLYLSQNIISVFRNHGINKIFEVGQYNTNKLLSLFNNDKIVVNKIIKRLKYFGFFKNEEKQNNKLIILMDGNQRLTLTNDFELSNPVIKVNRFGEEKTFFAELNERIDNVYKITFNISSLDIAGEYEYSLYDSQTLIYNKYKFQLQKKGLKIKDNH